MIWRERGGRLETDSWEEAVEIWHSIIDNPTASDDVKGVWQATTSQWLAKKRGLLSTALDWAQKSYGNYGNTESPELCVNHSK